VTIQRASPLVVLSDLWSARELVLQFVRRDLTVRYSQSSMGVLWAILNPALVVLSGLMIRLAISRMGGAPLDASAAADLALRALPWSFFAGALTVSTASIVAHASLIGKVFFVREAVPVSSVIGQSLDSLIGCVAVSVMLAALGFDFSLRLLWLLPTALCLVVFTMGVALVLSCANLFFRDVKYLVQVFVTFGLFLTPVFFGPEALGQRGSQMMLLFPVATFVQAFGVVARLDNTLMSTVSVATKDATVVVWTPWHAGYLMLVSMLMLVVGFVTFRRFSGRFAESV
jgi:lipopolysaccharide transport system permease protein